MSIVHYTTRDRVEKIIKSGLRTNSEKNLTLNGGDYSNYIYNMYTGVNRPIYFCIEEGDSISDFKKESDVAIEVNLKEENLVADLQSLVDFGAIYTEDGEYIYFRRLPQIFKEYGFDNELMVCDLLEVGNPAAEAAIKLTRTGVYLNSLSTKSIQKISELGGFGLLGDCTNSFDDDGDSLIDIFTDVSDFAYVEENSKEVDINTFLNAIHLPYSEFQNNFGQFKNVQFLENEDRGIYMLYDEDSDVHYFFKEGVEKSTFSMKKKSHNLSKKRIA